MAGSPTRRASPVLIGIVGGIVLGLIATTLVAASDGESEEAAPARVSNVAKGDPYPRRTVDCTDPAGDTRAGGNGIPIELPPVAKVGARTDAEITISCAGLQNNRWLLVGPNPQTRSGRVFEVKSDVGYVHMFSNYSDVQPHPNTLYLYGPTAPKAGQMTVELQPAGNQTFRPTGQSNILGVTFSISRVSAPKTTVDCLDPHWEKPEGDVSIYVPIPYKSGADVTIKCDPLKDKRWQFTQGGDSVGSAIGQLGFFADRTTLRLYPNPAVERGSADVVLKPLSGETFKGYMGDRVRIRLNLTPYKVYAIGDSWTAAFGYYGDGSLMPVLDLPFCRPGSGVLNDRCSSNSDLRGFGKDEDAPLRFSPDYGWKNNISWAAQVAHQVIAQTGGDYVNMAVSGATPDDYFARGEIDRLRTLTVAADPDLVLVTLGGNPILSDVLDRLKECEGDRARGALRECATRLVDSKYHVQERLTQFYRSMLEAPRTRIIAVSYMTAIVPYFPFNDYKFGEWEVMGGVLNNAIAQAVSKLKAESPEAQRRLFLVPPVRVNMGNEDPNGKVQCRRGGRTFRTAGPSVLADIVQDDISISSQANRFCGLGAEYLDGNTWRPAGTDRWFNGQDLGTHLTPLGNKQLADAAMNVIRAERLLPGS